MTENAEPKLSLIEEFKALGTKQWIAVIGTFAVCLVLVCTGIFLAMCMGFFIVAILLYMIPHITGVTSPKVKAVIGALFLAIILIVSAVGYGDSAHDRTSIPKSNTIITEGTFDGDTGIITIISNEELDLKISYSPITGMAFGNPSTYDKSNVTVAAITHTDNKYTATIDMADGKYYYIEASVNVDNKDAKTEYWQIFYNNGISSSDVNMLNLNGSWLSVVEIGAIFFIMLIFSELMRRSARKKRDQMIKDGRLYPAGYDRCKECGTMVLPGEIVCRKCGTPIEVPEDIKVLHKKDYFECSECGTEVPLDAKFCPKCRAVFDEETETEISHADGSVDVSSETFECSECGKEVPANAKRCPYCGAEFDEDDE